MKHQKISIILLFTVCSALYVNATDLGSILGPLLMAKQGLLGTVKGGVNGGFDAKSGLLKSLQGTFSGGSSGGLGGLFGSKSKPVTKESFNLGENTAGEYSSSSSNGMQQYTSNGGYDYAPKQQSNAGYNYQRPAPVSSGYATSSHNNEASEHSSGSSNGQKSSLGGSSGLDIGSLFGSIG